MIWRPPTHGRIFVVCRAGALTVAELAAAAKPALLVPFPFAVDDHQRVNADVLVKAGRLSVSSNQPSRLSA